ncbi:SusD/RagB family nutrient-binding outer membrane lipoprotein [Flavihumibacter sp. R14]|nr:SusD/RagB family nutrient-binding outer membrane lipoprotein [Flavihumibacter soli]
MKKNFRYILAFLLIGVISSCKDYFDLDNNPNLVVNPPLNSLLSTTTQKTGLNSQTVADITSYFVQYLANPGAGGSTDTYQITDYTTTWDTLYLAMADIYDMKAKALAEGSSEHVGVANILMSYNLTLVADMFGDAPYSEAFAATTLTPKYDPDEELYTESLRLLDEAVVELAKTDSRVHLSASDDFIHHGNVANWVKTAYALKARLLNKVSKKPNYNPAAVLEAISLSYTSNADDAQMSGFLGLNPWASIALDNSQLILDGWLSEQFMEHINGVSYGVLDPRIAKITDKTVNGDYKGTPNGVGNVGPGTNTVKDETYITRNSPLTSDAAPLILVSFAELKMIEAEAQLRLANPTAAHAAYLAGITAHMNKLGVTPAESDAYLASAAVSTSPATFTIDHIFQEKFIITYLNPEAWNDARRYDYKYKNFTLPANAALPTFIRRVAYPVGETSKNGPNVPTVSSLAEKVWWDE